MSLGRLIASLLVVGTGACASRAPRPPQLPLCEGDPTADEARWLALSHAQILATARPAMQARMCHRATDIQEAFRARHPGLRACYEDALARDREARGLVGARFTIARDGDVPLMCIATSEIQDAALVECLLDVLEHVQVPAADATCQGGERQRVTYPLVFTPAEEQRAPAR